MKKCITIFILFICIFSIANAEISLKIRQAARDKIGLAYGLEWAFLRTVDHPDLGNNEISVDGLAGNDESANYTFCGIQATHKIFDSKADINPFIGIKAGYVTAVRVGAGSYNNSGWTLLLGTDFKLKAGQFYILLLTNYPQINQLLFNNYGGLIAEVGYRFYKD